MLVGEAADPAGEDGTSAQTSVRDRGLRGAAIQQRDVAKILTRKARDRHGRARIATKAAYHYRGHLELKIKKLQMLPHTKY